MPIFLDRSNVNGSDRYDVAPVTHLYLKVSEGTGFVDSTYQTRRAQALRAGAHVGGYHFAGHNDPTAEADFFLSKLVGPNTGDLRPCLDLESGQSQQWAEQFVLHVKKRLGYFPVLYGSTSFIGPMRSVSKTLRSCPWWRAEFGPNDGHHHALAGGNQGAVAHQYTSVASVPGISGNTDRSVILEEKLLFVPGARTFKKWGVYANGDHKRNFRSYRRALLWANRHKPKVGGAIQIRHRDPGGSS